MKVKMLLFPGYVCLGSARCYSHRFFGYLKEEGVEIEAVSWDGDLRSIPTDEEVIVRASTRLCYSFQELAHYCNKYGHLVYYDDRLVTQNGEEGVSSLLDAAAVFLQTSE